MRRKTGFLITFMLAATFFLTTGFQKKYKYDFALFIGGCYESDEIGIKINGIKIIDSLVAKTDSSGYANISVIHSNEGLFVFWKDNRKELDRIELKKEMEFEISVNGIKTLSKINLRDGKVLIADYCAERNVTGRMTIRQYTIKKFKKGINLE